MARGHFSTSTTIPLPPHIVQIQVSPHPKIIGLLTVYKVLFIQLILPYAPTPFISKAWQVGAQAMWLDPISTPSLPLASCVCVCTRARLVAQSCPTLRDPFGCSPPGSSVHGIFQARVLKWVAMPSSRGSPQSPQTRVSYVSCMAGGFLTC